jgi:hypothetical protein
MMDPRQFILSALHEQFRKMALDDFGFDSPTWSDGEFVRDCSLRIKRGDSAAWQDFEERLATQYGFAPQMRNALVELEVIYRDVDTGKLSFVLPDGVATIDDDCRERALELLDSEFPVDWRGARRAAEAHPPKHRQGNGEIMYIEMKAGLTGPARIGRVFFSQTRKTLYYGTLVLKSLKGSGYKANYVDVASDVEYWVSKCKKKGNDTLYSGIVEIDEDVREEYWTTIRGQPENCMLSTFRSGGKYRK